MKILSALCRGRIILAVALLTISYAQNICAQTNKPSPEDSLSTLLLNKKWYIYQLYQGGQTMTVSKAERAHSYFFFGKTELEMNGFGDNQRGAYTLDAKSRAILLNEENGGSMKILYISRDELRLELMEEQQQMGWLLRAKP